MTLGLFEGQPMLRPTITQFYPPQFIVSLCILSESSRRPRSKYTEPYHSFGPSLSFLSSWDPFPLEFWSLQYFFFVTAELSWSHTQGFFPVALFPVPPLSPRGSQQGLRGGNWKRSRIKKPNPNPHQSPMNSKFWVPRNAFFFEGG